MLYCSLIIWLAIVHITVKSQFQSRTIPDLNLSNVWSIVWDELSGVLGRTFRTIPDPKDSVTNVHDCVQTMIGHSRSLRIVMLCRSAVWSQTGAIMGTGWTPHWQCVHVFAMYSNVFKCVRYVLQVLQSDTTHILLHLPCVRQTSRCMCTIYIDLAPSETTTAVIMFMISTQVRVLFKPYCPVHAGHKWWTCSWFLIPDCHVSTVMPVMISDRGAKVIWVKTLNTQHLWVYYRFSIIRYRVNTLAFWGISFEE